MSTTLIGAEGLYSETFDNLHLREEINFDKQVTFRKNDIEYNLKNNIKVNSSSAFDASTLPTSKTSLTQGERSINKELSNFYEYRFDNQHQNFLPLFGGKFYCLSEDEFIHNTLQLYTDFPIWRASIEQGQDILSKKMKFRENYKVLSVLIVDYLANLKQRREANHLMQTTWDHTFRAREEMAKKIFYKERLRTME